MRRLRRELRAFLDDELPEIRALVYPNQIVLDGQARAMPRKQNVSLTITGESSGFVNEPIRITVKAVGGGERPTGQITIYDDGHAVRNSTRDLEDGVAVLTLTYRTVSHHAFTARYSGDSEYYDQPLSNTLLVSLNERRLP